MVGEGSTTTGHGRRVVGGRRRAKVEGRRHRVEVSFTDEELDRVKANAERGGWSLTAWVAVAALTPPAGVVDEEPLGEREVLMREWMRAQRQLRGIGVNVNQMAAAMNTALADAPADGPTRGQVDEVLKAVERLPDVALAVLRVVARVRDAVIALQRERRR